MRIIVLTVVSFALSSGAASAATCEELRAFSHPHTTITAVQNIAAAADVPAHCRVTAVIRPVAGSEIGVQVWLPENWNGKFQGVGNGGWAGNLSLGALADAIKDGYAAASTDTGHQTTQGGAAFAVGHPEKVTDFAWRSVHEMTLLAKAVIARLYARPARLSYFNGCSTGGRQGMMTAQRFPADYDAIVVGAPVYNMIHLSASNLARQVEIIKDPARKLPPAKVEMLSKAVVAACDERDGLRDGLIGAPNACTFDPAVLACKAGDGPDCLTAPQVATVKRAYEPTKSRSGATIYPGSSLGFETGLRMPDAPLELHHSPFGAIGRQVANWDPMTFDMEKDLALTMQHGGSIEATNPDLSAFKARGGKMLFYHGWADPGPAPANTLAYVSAVEQKLGGKQDDWLRVFMMPGMGHCRGGVGPDQADFVAAIDTWRDGGVAPARIEAAKVTNNKVEMTRPLCPYPQIARYKGTGSTNEAANFVCAAN